MWKGGIQWWETKVVMLYYCRKKQYLGWEENIQACSDELSICSAIREEKEALLLLLTKPASFCLWYKMLCFRCHACLAASHSPAKRCLRACYPAYNMASAQVSTRKVLENCEVAWGKLKKITQEEDRHKSWVLCSLSTPWESASAHGSRKSDPSWKRQLVTKRNKEA